MPGLPPIQTLGPVALAPFVLLDGPRPRRAMMGMWTAYVPSLRLKLFHGVGGRLHCIARAAPPRAQARGEPWGRAFATPATRRAAENWVILRRLHDAGLGPEPLGLAVAPRYLSWFTGGWTQTAGVLVADLRAYPPKLPATEAEVVAAGVIPDARRACLREQVRGYVSDLNAARPAMPVGAEDEVAALAQAMDAALSAAGAPPLAPGPAAS